MLDHVWKYVYNNKIMWLLPETFCIFFFNKAKVKFSACLFFFHGFPILTQVLSDLVNQIDLLSERREKKIRGPNISPWGKGTQFI